MGLFILPFVWKGIVSGCILCCLESLLVGFLWLCLILNGFVLLFPYIWEGRWKGARSVVLKVAGIVVVFNSWWHLLSIPALIANTYIFQSQGIEPLWDEGTDIDWLHLLLETTEDSADVSHVLAIVWITVKFCCRFEERDFFLFAVKLQLSLRNGHFLIYYNIDLTTH